tara:strand:+ start:856 stop:1551 length:696 start_codon:yes stop_codon:yes gene_type:complete
MMTNKTLPLRTVSTQEAMAMAFAAYRVNKGYIKDTRRFSEDNPTQFSNKEIMAYTFKNTNFAPNDFIPFKPQVEDYEAVEEARKWLKRYVLLGLGNLDEFKRDMIESVQAEEVPVTNLGRVAFIPEFIRRDKHESALKKEIRIEYRDSQHIGKEKDNVEGVAKILDKFYSSKWETFNFTAVMNGNLVSYMNKYDRDVGTMVRIKAKVKTHTKNRLFQANETRLNYVKVYKV